MRSTELSPVRHLWLLPLLAFMGEVMAHEPVARCVLMDASTVRCRGATNDGAAMAGSRMEVVAHDGATLLLGKLDKNSTLTFKKPVQPFYVLFDTGPGLQAIVEQEEIHEAPLLRAQWMKP